MMEAKEIRANVRGKRLLMVPIYSKRSLQLTALRSPAAAVLGFALAVGLILRIAGATAGGLWLDEFQTWWLSSGEGLVSIMERCEAQLTQFPLFYFLARLATGLFGKSELALRLPAIVSSIGAIVAIFFLARRLFDQWTALAAAMIAAVATLQVNLGTWGRPYSLMLFLGLLSMLSYLHWLKKPGFAALSLHVLSSVLLSWTHLLALPLLLVQTLHLLLVERKRTTAWPFLCALAVIGILVLPLAGQALTLEERSAEFSFLHDYPVLTLLFSILEYYLECDIHLFVLPILFLLGLAGVFGRKTAAPQHQRRAAGKTVQNGSLPLQGLSPYWLLAVWIAVLAGAPILMLFISGASVFSSFRYFVLIAIPLNLALALLVAWIGRRRQRAWLVPLAYGVLYLMFARIPDMTVTAAFQIPTAQEWSAGFKRLSWSYFVEPEPFEDWRGATADLDRAAAAGESVYLYTGYVESNFERFVTDPVLAEYLAGPLGDFYMHKKLNVHLVPRDPANELHQKTWQEAMRKETGRFWLLGRMWPELGEVLAFFQRLHPATARSSVFGGRREGYAGGLILVECTYSKPEKPSGR